MNIAATNWRARILQLYRRLRMFLTKDSQKGEFRMTKSIFISGLLLLVSACSNQNDGVADSSDVLASSTLTGKEFCRMVETGGFFGQPEGKSEHCIQFLEGKKVKDNANTFFGNPPQYGTYSLVGKTITLIFENKKDYVLSSDGESISSSSNDKVVLTLKGIN